MTRKRDRKPALPRQGKGEKDQKLVTYEITYQPIRDRTYKSLPSHIKKAIQRLHDEAQLQPQKAIPELRELINRYPEIPIFYNYLTAAYTVTRQWEKRDETIRENYRRNPDYLFARLNYVQLCMDQGNLDRVPEILNYTYDLKLMYPDRDRFHITEVENFLGIVGIYLARVGKRKNAEMYYKALKQLSPDAPMTQELKRELDLGYLVRTLRRLAYRSRSKAAKRPEADADQEDTDT